MIKVNKVLVSNVAYTFLLQLFSTITPLIVIPHLSRNLSIDEFGRYMFFTSLGLLLSFLIEFGTNISASRELSKLENEEKRSHFITSVVIIKLIASVLVGILIIIFEDFGVVPHSLSIYAISVWLYAVATGMSPFWYFQSTQSMRIFSLSETIFRLLGAMLVLILVGKGGYGYKAISYQSLALLASDAILHFFIFKKVKFKFAGLGDVLSTARRSISMLTYRIIVSLYTYGNSFFLGLVAPVGIVGGFSSIDKICKSALSLLSPINQVIFPKIVSLIDSNRNQANRVHQIFLFVTVVLSLLFAAVIFTFSEKIILIILGDKYTSLAPFLKVYSFVIPVIAVNNALGMQWMVPRGMDKSFNYIILVAGIVNVLGIVIMVPQYELYGIIWSILLSEALVLIMMILAISLDTNTSKKRAEI